MKERPTAAVERTCLMAGWLGLDFRLQQTLGREKGCWGLRVRGDVMEGSAFRLTRFKTDDDAVTIALDGNNALYVWLWLRVAACLLCTVWRCNGLSRIQLPDSRNNGRAFSPPETRLVKGESQTPPTNGYQKHDG
jgi:hypothetical protein